MTELREINWRNEGTTPMGSWVANPASNISLHAIPAREGGGWIASATYYNGLSMELMGFERCRTEESAKVRAETFYYREWRRLASRGGEVMAALRRFQREVVLSYAIPSSLLQPPTRAAPRPVSPDKPFEQWREETAALLEECQAQRK